MAYMNLFDEYCFGNWLVLDTCVKAIIEKLKIRDVFLPNTEETLKLWSIKQKQYGFDSFP